LPLFNVHKTVSVRVVIYNVEAADPKSAAKEADEAVASSLFDMFPDTTPATQPDTSLKTVAFSAGYMEECDGYLVDVVGEPRNQGVFLDADYQDAMGSLVDPAMERLQATVQRKD
jgi:hypothetical protein